MGRVSSPRLNSDPSLAGAIAILHSRPGINAKEAFVVVPRWRGSHEADTKVPSSILYKGRKAFAFGHEAEDYPEDDGKVVRNFKLILHPPEMRHLTERGPGGGQTPFEIPVLPSGVSIEDAYTDYLKFLIAGAKDFFVGTAESLGTSDAAAWTRLIGSAHFVVSVPNGWHEPQKAVVRAAMKRASPTTGSVFFPSEAETSLHYLLNAPMKVLDLTVRSLLFALACIEADEWPYRTARSSESVTLADRPSTLPFTGSCTPTRARSPRSACTVGLSGLFPLY